VTPRNQPLPSAVAPCEIEPLFAHGGGMILFDTRETAEYFGGRRVRATGTGLARVCSGWRHRSIYDKHDKGWNITRDTGMGMVSVKANGYTTLLISIWRILCPAPVSINIGRWPPKHGPQSPVASAWHLVFNGNCPRGNDWYADYLGARSPLPC